MPKILLQFIAVSYSFTILFQPSVTYFVFGENKDFFQKMLTHFLLLYLFACGLFKKQALPQKRKMPSKQQVGNIKGFWQVEVIAIEHIEDKRTPSRARPFYKEQNCFYRKETILSISVKMKPSQVEQTRPFYKEQTVLIEKKYSCLFQSKQN